MIIDRKSGKFKRDVRDCASKVTLTAQSEMDGYKLAFIANCFYEGNFKDMNRRFEKHCREAEKRKKS